MEEVKAQVAQLVEAIKNSEPYKRYSEVSMEVRKSPKLWQELTEYRRNIFEMQMELEGDALFDTYDHYEKDNEQFRRDPLVNNYLNAELDLCRMIQKIDAIILDAIDIEL